MPCYMKAANDLNTCIPEDVNLVRLEEILMNILKIPFKRHVLLRRELNKFYTDESEKLKELLIGAIALAGKKEKKKEFPDRLKDLRKQADKIWKTAN